MSPVNFISCSFGNFYIPQRYILVVMLHLMMLNTYHMRMVYNIAITEMVQEHECNDTEFVDACPEFTYEETVKDKSEHFQWSPNWTSFTLYSFYIGYVISHLPGGWLADKFGARHIMGTGMIISTIVTAVFPVVVTHFQYAGAACLRILLGLSQGPLIPSISTFIQCWIPRNHRGFLGGIALSGSNLGTLTGSSLTGLMIYETTHWSIAFYAWAGLSCFCICIYMLAVFSRPKTHPFITEAELLYLEDKVEHHSHFHVPFGKIFKSMPFWALLAGQFGHNFIFFIMFTDIPKYLKDIQKMEILENGLYTALPFLALWVSGIGFGIVSDVLINHEWLRVITARKCYTAFATMVPSCFLLLTGYAGCHQEIAIASYTIALFCVGPFFSGVKINVNDLTIHYGGTVMAMINGMGSLAGIIATSLIGKLTCDCSLESWQLVFWIDFGVSTFCTVFYCIFASADRQEWDFTEEDAN